MRRVWLAVACLGLVALSGCLSGSLSLEGGDEARLRALERRVDQLERRVEALDTPSATPR